MRSGSRSLSIHLTSNLATSMTSLFSIKLGQKSRTIGYRTRRSTPNALSCKVASKNAVRASIKLDVQGSSWGRARFGLCYLLHKGTGPTKGRAGITLNFATNRAADTDNSADRQNYESMPHLLSHKTCFINTKTHCCFSSLTQKNTLSRRQQLYMDRTLEAQPIFEEIDNRNGPSNLSVVI